MRLGNRLAASATAGHLLTLAGADAERVLREQPGVALAVLRVLAGRLRKATEDHRT